MKTLPGDRKSSSHRPVAPAPTVTAPSSQSLPFAIASTVGPPRRAGRTNGGAAGGIADQLKTRAPQAALRGDHARALDLYRSLVALEPTVPLHRIRAGDCHVKLGQKREALVEYRKAADAYVAMGLHAHARSAWRLVLGIVPGDADASARLAALDARTRGARVGTPPPVPSAAGAIPAPPPPAGAPRTRGGKTPTAPESEIRAERERASAALAKRPEAILPASDPTVTPVVAKRGDVRSVAVAPPPAPASTPSKSQRVEPAKPDLALEFADLDDEADCLWIDLEGIVEREVSEPSPLVFREEPGEPVAFFSETSEPGPVRQSVAVAGPPSSLIEEQTRPVPAPDSQDA